MARRFDEGSRLSRAASTSRQTTTISTNNSGRPNPCPNQDHGTRIHHGIVEVAGSSHNGVPSGPRLCAPWFCTLYPAWSATTATRASTGTVIAMQRTIAAIIPPRPVTARHATSAIPSRPVTIAVITACPPKAAGPSCHDVGTGASSNRVPSSGTPSPIPRRAIRVPRVSTTSR